MKSIMLVGKQLDDLEPVKEFLKQNDINVFTAPDSRQAMELMQQEEENNFELFLIDSVHPDSNKPAFLSLRPMSKMTSDIDNVDDFLERPFTGEQLMEFLNNKI